MSTTQTRQRNESMENGSPNSLPDWAEIIDGEQAKPDDGPVRKGGHGK